MRYVVHMNTTEQAWWDQFTAEATARGDANRIPTAERQALALMRAGYSPFTAAHTLF